MKRTRRTLAIITLTTLMSCSTPAVPASTPTTSSITLRLYTTTATASLSTELIDAYTRLNPTVRFESETGNYEVMVSKLLAGEMPYFLSNHLPQDSSLWGAPLGQDGIVMITHPANRVSSLSTAELRAIYQGHIANWRTLNGMDSAISVFSREKGSGTRAEFEELVMGTRQTTQAARVVPSTAAMLESVAALPGSIGYVSLSALSVEVKALAVGGIGPSLETVADNTYPLRATLYIVGLAEPETDYRAFIGWAQGPQGQGIIARLAAPLLPLEPER